MLPSSAGSEGQKRSLKSRYWRRARTNPKRAPAKINPVGRSVSVVQFERFKRRTEDEIVAFGKANGVVYSSHAPDEFIARKTTWDDHVVFLKAEKVQKRTA